MIIKLLIIMLGCLPGCSAAGAQTRAESGRKAPQEPGLLLRTLTVRYHHGIVIPHHPNMVYFIDDFSRGVELNYGLLRFDKDSWQRWYNYPEVGLGLFYNSYGNDDIYGQGLALYPYLHFPIVRTSRFELKNKLALGLGYTNRPFDYRENPRNHIFGAYLNAYIGLGLYSSYRFTDQWSAVGAVALNHMSNGASRKPNNGINTFTLAVGMKYHFSPRPLPLLARQTAPRSRRRALELFAGFGRSQASDYNFNIYSSGSLSLHHKWYRSVKSAWSAGLDVFYFGGAHYVYQNPKEYDFEASRIFYGASVGKYWIMGSTTPFVQLGVYLWSQIDPPQPLYPRVGIRQDITSRLMANFSVKASFFRAEFIELGLGYRLDL